MSRDTAETETQAIQRRSIKFASLDEMLADAERLSGQAVRTVGNWSQAQIYDHMADSLNISIDGTRNAPAPLRFILSLFFKRKFLHNAIPSGFNAGANVPQSDRDVESALANLRAAVRRQKEEKERAMHPGFGRISNEEWELFHLRHAELHFSFIVPETD